MKGRVFRLVNDEDLVSNLPPNIASSSSMDYRHFGALVLFDQHGHAHYQHPAGRWLKVKQQLNEQGFWQKIINHIADVTDVMEPIKDHHENRYAELCHARFDQFGT